MGTTKYTDLKRNILSLTILTVAGLTATARTDENDQFWLTGTLKGRMSDKVSVKVTEQHRYKNTGHYYRHTEPGVDYTINGNWSVSAAFRLIAVKNTAGDWKHIYGYIIDPAYVAEGWGAALKFRFRFAYYDPHTDRDSASDCRPKFILSPASGFTSWKVKPYLADEIMFNFDAGNLYRNRLSAGLKCKPHKSLSLDLFVMHESTEKDNEWKENWNAGLGGALSF